MVSRVPVTSFTEARRVNSVRWISCIAVAAAYVVSAAAWSQGRLDADSLRAFGGTYSPNCSNPQAPRAHVTAAALMVEQGNQRMTGGNVQAAASFLGPSPPPNYRTVLLGEVRGQQLQFILFQDAAGYYLTLDGDQRVRAALGKTLLGHRYRQCGVSAKAPATSPPPAAAAPRSAPAASGAPAGEIPPLDTMTAPGLLMDPKFKAAWHRALGPKAREPWLGELDGPSPDTKKVRVDGAEYFLGAACKNRDCSDNSLVVLYSEPRGVVYGHIHERGRVTRVGGPPPAVASELERLWRDQWRKQN
jgi:hypothetical protein